SASLYPHIEIAIPELDIEPLAGGHLRHRPHRAALAVPHERIAALEHRVVAERVEQLATGFQVPPMGCELPKQGRCKALAARSHTLPAAGNALDHDLWGDASPDALKAGASWPRHACKRPLRAPAECLKPIARAQKPRLEQPRMEPQGAALQPH